MLQLTAPVRAAILRRHRQEGDDLYCVTQSGIPISKRSGNCSHQRPFTANGMLLWLSSSCAKLH